MITPTPWAMQVRSCCIRMGRWKACMIRARMVGRRECRARIRLYAPLFSIAPPSLRLDTRLLHHHAPASGFVAHEGAELFRAAALQVGALLAEIPANVLHLENFAELCIEPLHDRRRRTARDRNAV